MHGQHMQCILQLKETIMEVSPIEKFILDQYPHLRPYNERNNRKIKAYIWGNPLLVSRFCFKVNYYLERPHSTLQIDRQID